MTREQIVKELFKMDQDVDPESEAFKAQLVMLAALSEETMDVKRLAKFTKIDISLVAKFAHNLRKNGIWNGRKVCADWAGEDGGISFDLDTCVAIGLMNRVA